MLQRLSPVFAGVFKGGVAAGIALYIWSFDIPYTFKEAWPDGYLYAAIIWAVLLAAWVPLRRIGRPLARIDDRVIAAGLGLAALIATGLIATLCYDRMPHVQDEINYLFQARLFSEFRLYADSHPLAEFFNFRFIVNDGRWYSLFQPGWPLAMTPFLWLGIPHLAAPFYAACAVAATYLIGCLTFGRGTALLGAVLLMTSPFFLYLSGSMMAHPFAMFATALMTWGALRWLKGGSARWMVLAGLGAGLLFNTRAATFLGVGGTLGLYALASSLRRPAALVRGTATAMAVFLPLFGLGLLYNHLLTGDALDFPQDHYFRLTETKPDCHRLGLGPDVGCIYEHGPDIHWPSFTTEIAKDVTRSRVNHFKGDLFGLSCIFILLIPGLIAGGWSAWLFVLMSASLAGVYFFYYYDGICFGARYYYETVFLLLLTLAHGAVGPAAALAEGRGGFLRTWGGRLLATAFLAVPLACIAYSIPNKSIPLWKDYDKGFWGVGPQCRDAVEAANLSHALVFGPQSDKDYRTCFVFMDHRLDDRDIIYVRDLGRHNENILRYYPERAAYQFRHGRMVPLRLKRRYAPDIFIDAAAKFPAPIMDRGVNETRPIAEGPREMLLYHAKGSADRVGFRHWIFEEGRYRVRLGLAGLPEGGVVRFAIDGVVACQDIDAYAEEPTPVDHACRDSVLLTKGLHAFTFEMHSIGNDDDYNDDDDDDDDGGDIGVEYIFLSREDAPPQPSVEQVSP